MRVKRRRICFLQVEDRLLPDFAQFLRGEITLRTHAALELMCPLSGERLALSAREVGIVHAVPAEEWREVEALAGVATSAELEALAARGVLLSDADTPEAARLREAEARALSCGWHGLAALYHAFSSWRGVVGHDAFNEHSPEAERMRLGVHVERHGAPPAHFVARDDALARTRLPVPELEGELFDAMRARRTVRAFRMDRELPLDALNKVLFAVFGAQGVRRLMPGITAVKKTSASGGGLHPTEAYLLLAQVEGMRPGIYHYEAGTHTLALLREVAVPELRAIAATCVGGQAYFAEAHALIIHVVRFRRHFWKYVEHLKAYKAVLMDSAHLSQTLYLTAAALGLGAFYTAAINDADIATLLDLAPLEESAVGVSGIGIADRERTAMEFHPEDYRPDAVALDVRDR